MLAAMSIAITEDHRALADTVRDFLARRNLVETKSWEAERARQRKVVEDQKAAAAAAAEKKAEAPADKAADKPA